MSFDGAWKRLTGRPKREQLRYLLLLRLRGPWSHGAEQKLRQFTGEQVLGAAGETYWPVEIEPLQMDGAYAWTTRAGKLEDNSARDVIRMSVRMPGGKPGRWVHLIQWDRWTYVFGFKASMLNKDAVAAAESSHALALPFNGGWPLDVRYACLCVRGVPASVRVPTVKIGREEFLGWSAGAVYEWARPLFPRHLQATLPFRKNKFPPPPAITPAGGSNPPKTR